MRVKAPMEILGRVVALIKAIGVFLVAATLSVLLLIGLVIFYALNAVFLILGVLGLFVAAVGYGGCSLFAITLPEKSLRALHQLWEWVEAHTDRLGS
jgi:hypothetical protein